jgi:hypothetical protein
MLSMLKVEAYSAMSNTIEVLAFCDLIDIGEASGDIKFNRWNPWLKEGDV